MWNFEDGDYVDPRGGGICMQFRLECPFACHVLPSLWTIAIINFGKFRDPTHAINSYGDFG
jgi:hypothetical protein